MKFSLTFVTYHGCGYCYVDSTNLLQRTTRCFFPIHDPFWKETCDTSNRISKSTRNQLKKKSIATRSYCKEYFNTFENTKKVIMLFSKMARYGKIGQTVQRIVQKINIQTQMLNQTIQNTQTNQKIQTTNFPYIQLKKKILFRP